MQDKYVKDSITERVQIIMPAHLNGADRLFGGQLAMWIDEVAGIVAIRHSAQQIVTVSIDHLNFREPVLQGEMIVLIGRITYVGRTSMEVRVDTYVEEPGGMRRLINTAFLVEVAIDVQGRPTEVPRLILQSQEEEREWRATQKRREYRERMARHLRDIYNMELESPQN